jgi:uncharacterized protein
MPLLFNMRHLEKRDLHLEGEISPEELEIESLDEMIHAKLPLTYALDVQKLERSILVQGSLELPLSCECVRCLKTFQFDLAIPEWALHLELEGEEAVPVTNDLVDLTPYVREDILLKFPQHPLCEPECGGLKDELDAMNRKRRAELGEKASPWSELNKLKLEEE